MQLWLPLCASLVLTIASAHPERASPSGSCPSTRHDAPFHLHHVAMNRETCHSKQFGGHTLAYVTPWNSRGYDVAEQFKGKFDYVSPVWYYLRRRSPDTFELEGEHDVDTDWLDKVRDPSPARQTGKVLPRFQFQGWSWEDWHSFSRSMQEARVATRLVMEQVKRYDFDGVVIECGQPVAFTLFLKHLASVLHAHHKELVVVLPPIRSEEQRQYMNRAMFASMAAYVDMFSLMTYDYSSHRREGGPSAPMDWLIDNIESLTDPDNVHKLLMGVNMYAMSYSPKRDPQPHLMQDIMSQLAHHKGGIAMHWDKSNREHWFTDTEQSTVWIPSVKAIQERIGLAEGYGVGLSIWEVGQGLDTFYDQF